MIKLVIQHNDIIGELYSASVPRCGDGILVNDRLYEVVDVWYGPARNELPDADPNELPIIDEVLLHVRPANEG